MVGLSEFNASFAPKSRGAASPAQPDSASSLALTGLRVPLGLFALCLAAQLYLVFFKSFNWDEFLHYSFVYQLKAGSVIQPFQVVHLRFLLWSTDAAADLVDQMLAARIFMWAVQLATLYLIYGVARHFTNAQAAFFASFAYFGAGYVFTQSFSIRVDPMVTATLMLALFLMLRGNFGLLRVIAIGSLVGLAGMMTFKAAFYAPCFAGLAWLKFHEAEDKPRFIGKLGVLVGAAILSFGAVYYVHTWNFGHLAGPSQNTASASLYSRWLTFGFPFGMYIAKEIILSPVFFLSLIFAPVCWKKSGLNANSKVALAGFIAPLAVLLFYRNTFPYFFVFIIEPAAVPIGPALSLARERYGSAFLAVLLSAAPLALAILEPRDMIGRQRALIDYVHQEFPRKTGYLDYSGMIADYPRILKYLTSGNGIRHYHEQGVATVGKEISGGNVPFIIANYAVISSALEGRAMPGTFLPEDLAAMEGNYVQQWGVLWREGVQIPAGIGPHEFQLGRGGVFVLADGPLTVDGTTLERGTRISLAKGTHTVTGHRSSPSKLWRGDRLPAPHPDLSMDQVFTSF